VRGFLAGLRRGVPSTVARHTLPEVRRKVAGLIHKKSFDVVHAEQLHALPQTRPAADLGIPVVHRTHNVESVLWSYSAQHRRFPWRSLISFEARRMSAYEAETIESCTATVALTQPDRRILSDLVPEAMVAQIAAPFPNNLPAGTVALDGDPAVVTLASSLWRPSRDAARELVERTWPRVRSRLPGARLHVFGSAGTSRPGRGVVIHASPHESREAFPEGAIALVPGRHPTGVPMKALEAWSRGLPLVVDEHTAETLDADDGENVVTARSDQGGYGAALARIIEEDGLRRHLITGGRRALRERHDPGRIADELVRVYRWAISKTR
jgi:hypothetical protein